MATALNIVLYALLAASLVAFFAALVSMVVAEENVWERTVQIMMMVAGAIVALGASASGVSFAEFAVDSLTGARPAGAPAKAVAVLVPGGIAAGFGWYFLRAMKRSTEKAMRLVGFLGMLTLISFIQV